MMNYRKTGMNVLTVKSNKVHWIWRKETVKKWNIHIHI